MLLYIEKQLQVPGSELQNQETTEYFFMPIVDRFLDLVLYILT